ncbi:GNAT family N-acetyltransferase [Litoricola sp.]|nr:GNAT family N-acetyltransferase [Litorivicinus sp.]
MICDGSRRVAIGLVTIEDIDDVFLWKNDPTSIQQSLNRESITWADHSDWFQQILRSANVCFLMCRSDLLDCKIGVVRFDIDASIAVLSINLDPQMRGLGFGYECLSNAIDFLAKNFKSVDVVQAKVRVENKISDRIFKKIGFVKVCVEHKIKTLELRLNDKG